MKFTGMAASPGVGVAPIYLLVREELAVRDTPIPAPLVEHEVLRFHAALETSRADLASIRDRIARELSEAEAEIYSTHLMILDDPDLVHAVEQGIREQRRNAAWVFRAHMAGVAAHMASVQSEHLRERQADVLDVERRVLRYLLGDGPRALATPEQPSVLIAHDVAPSEIALLDRERIVGMVTEVGSRSSHCAIVARGRGIPAVVSCRGIMQHATNGAVGAVDGFLGTLEIDPDAETTEFFAARRKRIEDEDRSLLLIQDQPTVTRDGHTVDLGANLELPGDVERALSVGAASVGLFRTEFFYLDRLELPSEEEQYQAYRHVVERMNPRPVLFRTMDVGGDKVASYLGTIHENNPFLGRRGIRLSLEFPEVFRAQVRAIYRASAHGRVRLMFPMISNLEELRSAQAMCQNVREELGRSGLPHDPELEIGLMVETPSAVWMADVMAREASFFSIGTNDLTQYTLAMDRDNERLAHLYEPLDPAVLRSIRHTVQVGHAAGRWVGVCGEMAGDPQIALLLIGLDVDELSVACFDLPRVKSAIRGVTLADARRLAGEALAQSTADDVKEVLRRHCDAMLPRGQGRRGGSS
jgi:phosphoenolpyruvate-protein phosphotransferase (PTS system enzyme I)